MKKRAIKLFLLGINDIFLDPYSDVQFVKINSLSKFIKAGCLFYIK